MTDFVALKFNMEERGKKEGFAAFKILDVIKGIIE